MDEQNDVWERVITVVIVVAIVCVVVAATFVLQPLLAKLAPPTVPTYIFTPTP